MKLTQNRNTLAVTKDLMKTPFLLAAKAASTRRNIYKNPIKWFQRAEMFFFFFLNWPTFNFKNGVLQQKRAPNKSKRFIFCQKPFPLARMKNLLKNTISVDQKTASIRISVWKKLKKTVSTNRNKIFLNIGLLLMTSIERKY